MALLDPWGNQLSGCWLGFFCSTSRKLGEIGRIGELEWPGKVPLAVDMVADRRGRHAR